MEGDIGFIIFCSFVQFCDASWVSECGCLFGVFGVFQFASKRGRPSSGTEVYRYGYPKRFGGGTIAHISAGEHCVILCLFMFSRIVVVLQCLNCC